MDFPGDMPAMLSSSPSSLLSRANYDPWFQHVKPPEQYRRRNVIAFRCLGMFGLAGCLLLTTTILISRRVVRHKSVPNFFAFLTLGCFVSNITWFTGNVDIWQTRNPPCFGLCYFQSIVLAGISNGQGLSAFFLVFQVWIAMSRTVFSSKWTAYVGFLESPGGQWALLASPWLAWIAYGIATGVVGALDNSLIRANSLYCASTQGQINDARHYTSAFFALVVVLLQIQLAYFAAVQWIRSRRRQRQAAATIVANTDHGISIDLEGLEDLLQPMRHDVGPFVIRVMIFSVYTLFLVGATVAIAVHPALAPTSFADLVNASIAPIAFVTFGSQSDCRQVWVDFLKAPLSALNKSGKRALSPRQERTPFTSNDLDPASPSKDEASTETELSKDVKFSLSIDSSVTTESGDFQKPHLPILNRDQYPLSRPTPSRMISAEDCPYDDDFFAALKSV